MARLEPPCAACGKPSAKIELVDETDGAHLVYSGPGGANGRGDRIEPARAEAIASAFTPPFEPSRIRAAGFHDDAGFCLPCAKFYCATHWQLTARGSGRCPAGHFKSLDPHWSPD